MTDDAGIEVAKGIHLVDAAYFRSAMTACYIVVEGGAAAIIDAGASRTPDLISAALARIGVKPEGVLKVILTHAHLDHCAGAAELLKRFPNAVAVAHENAAPHIIDPFDKLWEATTSLWGESFSKEHYGCVDKVDPGRLMQAADGDVVEVGARRLGLLYTPGHAWHHMSIHDPGTGTLFTGDAFGVSYREFDTQEGASLLIPTSPPNQFKPDVMKDSVLRQLDLNPNILCVTHFGVVRSPQQAGRQLIECIDRSMEIAAGIRSGNPPEQRMKALSEGLRRLYVGMAVAAGSPVAAAEAHERLAFDAELSAKGILHYLDREEQKTART